jgi:hypothetical protein
VGNFAAGVAFETALKLEKVGRSGNLSDAEKWFAKLETEVSELSRALAELGMEEAA